MITAGLSKREQATLAKSVAALLAESVAALLAESVAALEDVLDWYLTDEDYLEIRSSPLHELEMGGPTP